MAYMNSYGMQAVSNYYFRILSISIIPSTAAAKIIPKVLVLSANILNYTDGNELIVIFSSSIIIPKVR